MNRISVKNEVSGIKSISAVICAAVLSAILLLKQNAVREALKVSIRLCFSSIFPTVFPFMILSDFLICSITINKRSRIGRLFEMATGICGNGLSAFILGNICGFPIGAHFSTNLYRNGNISDDEYARLLPISTNPSFAFVVSGLGMGIRASLSDGIKLYISLILATVISSAIWKNNKSAEYFDEHSNKTEFSLAASIKNSVSSLIYVFAYIFFFSIVINASRSFGLSPFATALISTFLEVGNAASDIYAAAFPSSLSLGLTAFALGFSGISMYVQVIGFTENNMNKNNRSMYIKIKVTEGVIAFGLALVLSLF